MTQSTPTPPVPDDAAAEVPEAPTRYGYEDLPHLMGRMTGAAKHGPAATSTMDAVWVLYDRVLRVAPHTVDHPGRDRFLLSKGHGPMAYYATLAAKGFFPVEWLPGFGGFDSPLGHHPDRTLAPGVEISSGSLGHGLPLAVGSTWGLRAQRRHESRVWVLVGDAELDEGSNHEAIDFAGAWGLDALHTVVIDNSSTSHRTAGDLTGRFGTAGWAVREVDGRDHEALYGAFTAPHPGRPLVVVARVEPKSG